ncbi:MAG: ABC transporter permease subunit [Gemmatimonadota bacterium]
MNGALMTVAWLTWRQLFARRRAWLAVAIVVLPFLLTFFYRFASEDREGDRLVFLMNLNRDLILGVLLPITAVIFGTTAFGGEVEDGTLIYLLVRPVPRWQVVLVKFAVAALVSAVIVAASVLLAWFALRNAELPPAFAKGFVTATLVGAVLYCGIFAYLGLVTRRGLVVGLIYTIVFENILARNLPGVKFLSVREYAISLAQWAGGDAVKWPAPGVPMTTVWVAGSIILAIALAATMRRLGRYEMAERL